MTAPIADFIDRYVKSDAVRFHMPGHKGRAGDMSEYDVTEFYGADALYCPTGIILESERNAASLFGTKATLYSTEGSSQCVKAMLLSAVKKSGSRKVIAARNVHSSFLSACALIDADVVWIGKCRSLVSCEIDLSELEETLGANPDAACVYVTSPDYLGMTADVKVISELAHGFSVPLLVDNAHGAYLAFLEENIHPAALGADLVCDSAHKTLPALTGAAYLHIPKKSAFEENEVRSYMELFGSTSPSYLILRSLDLLNAELSANLPEAICSVAELTLCVKRRLRETGFAVLDTPDALKLTIDCHSVGCSGDELGKYLASYGVMCEYSDSRYLVLLASANSENSDFGVLLKLLYRMEKREPIADSDEYFTLCETVVSLRQSLLLESEEVDASDAVGRVCAFYLPHCPPAVAPVVGGQRITRGAAEMLRLSGKNRIRVIKDNKI